MGIGTLASRANGNYIDETWFNQFRTALIQDIYPRNTSGAIADATAGLGTSSYRFSSLHILGYTYLYDALSSHYLRQGITPGLSSDITLFWPASIPPDDNNYVMMLGSSDSSTASIGSISTNDLTDLMASYIPTAIGSTGANSIIQQSTRGSNTGAVGGVSISDSTGVWFTTSTSFVDVTNLSATVVVSAAHRPIFGMLTSDGSGNYSSMDSDSTAIHILIKRGSTEVYRTLITSVNNSIFSAPGCVQFIDTGASAGSNTYQVQLASSTSGVSVRLKYVKLIVWELT